MEFSVVIPTYNRSSILLRTLSALTVSLQSFRKACEVIVVDDGSVDDTRGVVQKASSGYPVPLRYFGQINRKQGAARNLGARHALGDYLVFLGDDTAPVPDFLDEHARSHHHCHPHRVVIGYTPWAKDYPKTRFMEYVGEQGWQFGFSLIKDPENLPFNFFYTSNLSIVRHFFWEGGGFDESFQEYGWEDMELSLRLKQKGMRLVYNPRAIAYHHHPTSLFSFVLRQRKVGHSAWNFYRRHPEMADFLSVLRTPRYTLSQRWKMSLLTWLCGLSETRCWPDLSRYYPDLMSYHYNRGVLEARRRGGTTDPKYSLS